MEETQPKKHIIYDVLYGFIHLTPLEWEIIHTPFYQRLKWVKQLGFSFYTFHGAEHSRFGHSIGVMYNAHCILQSIGKAVADEDLYAMSKSSTAAVKEHQAIRLAALLHDIGTFPFSHTTENSYIRFGETSQQKNSKGHPDDHEHLGSFIIKKTRYQGGITQIIESYGIDPVKVSNLVKGIDENILANQILHSEVDCDRMDYLLRDAHYTGLDYGAYDREYLLHHFRLVKIGIHEILTINEKALYCIQDFLMSRFAWYSQVVRSHRGAKYDAIAEEVCFYLLKNDLIYSYSELLEIIEKDPVKFYSFNDNYFMTLIHRLYSEGGLKKSPKIQDMTECLLFEKSPAVIKAEPFKQRILEQSDSSFNEKIIKKTKERLQAMQDYLEKHGTEKDWIIDDLPKKGIYLVKSSKKVIKDKTQVNVLFERDPTKILTEDGNVKLMSDMENSMIAKLQNHFNFIPNAFCSQSAYELLKKGGFLVSE
jgi:HD superfamily phosphohydrolase